MLSPPSPPSPLVLDLLLFAAILLLTGFTSLILSSGQTIRTFHPPDATLWHTYTHDTFPTYYLFLFYYLLIPPVLLRLLPRNAHNTRLVLGMLPATMLACLLVELGKGYVGRLRPSFATLCLNGQPNVTWTSLPDIHSDAGCATPIKDLLHDARRSFPSGHAALAVSGAAYFQLCLWNAMKGMSGQEALVWYVVGWFVMTGALWVAASRVVDFAHHVGDVAVGGAIGLWAAGMHYAYVEVTAAAQGKDD
eukprot:GFKZ01010645.1.p1 GENE.GFKZ01010645.1~~GFKZ01010645.1.p1  ORF type:complete len:249 (-),score=15.60 GFKZ01010645.1:306-1052(-)